MSLLVAGLDLVPRSVLGVEFDTDQQRGAVAALLVFVIVALGAFVVFARADFARAREEMAQIDAEVVDELRCAIRSDILAG